MNSEWKPTPGEEGKIDPAKYRVDHSLTLGYTAKQIDDLRPPFVIDNFIRRGGVLLLGAEPKSRKSWMAKDAGFSVVAGTTWLSGKDGAGGFKTAKARAHVFDLELDEGEMKYRFAKTRQARFPEDELAELITEGFFHYNLEGLPAEEVMAVIEACLPEIKPGDIVVIDCFYRLCPDSNDPGEVAHIFNMVKAWAKQTQAAWIIVDHFRKAGADKARDRFAGSFIKQAGPGCLVAIEVRKDGLFELQIDARSFQHDERVWCRWDSDGYRFVRVSEAEVSAARVDAAMVQMVAWLRALWSARDFTADVTVKDAAPRWSVTDQAARNRFRKLRNAGLVEITRGRPMTIALAEPGRPHVQPLTGKPA